MRRGLVCFLVGLLSALPALAQTSANEPIRLTLRPAVPPTPALKYHLLPDLRDQTPGNAALGYYRALSFRGEMGNAPQFEEKQFNWISTPLKDLPRQEVRRFLDEYRFLLRQVEDAARMESCDWQLTARAREEGLSLQLPEIQQTRLFANLLALQARLAMAEGQIDKALATLQTGFTLARHVGEAPLLISNLVAMAIAGQMAAQLEELIQTPGAPNLYWPLAELPQPYIYTRRGLQAERTLVDAIFPGLRDPKTGPLSPQQVLVMVQRFFRITAGQGARDSDDPGLRLGFGILAAKLYPEARLYLLRHGWPVEQVDVMPVTQVALTYMIAEYDQRMDEMLKWHTLPLQEAKKGFDAMEKQLRQDKSKVGNMQNMQTILAALLLPTVHRVVGTSARLDRRLAAIRCIEAIRLHAATHEGKLPAQLSDITEVPVPIDPMTGKPFEYKVTGDKATLTGPGVVPYLLAYELTLQR